MSVNIKMEIQTPERAMLACYFYDIFSGDGRECLPVQAGYVSIRKCRSAAELVTLHRVRVEPGYALPGPLKPLRVRPAITDGGRSAARKAVLCKTLASPLGARALAIPGQRGPSRAYPGSTLAVDSQFGSCYRLSGGTKPLVGFQLVDWAARDGPRGRVQVFRTV